MPDRKKAAGGDAPVSSKEKIHKKKDKKEEKPPSKSKKEKEPEPEPEKSPSEIRREGEERRALQRKERFKKRWPEVSKATINTRPWRPPPPPKRLPRISIQKPQLITRQWVPPHRRRRKQRPKLMRVPPEEVTQPLPYECSLLKKVWHWFNVADRNKMMLQGTLGCDSKRYITYRGAQTACIAAVCKAMLEEKPESQLQRRDVDDIIEHGDRYYTQCLQSMKCYKGNPSLQLNQILPSFFLHDTKYTIKLNEVDKGILIKHPDSTDKTPDLLTLMEKRAGTKYSMILTVGDKHFLIWGHPPESGGQVKTICYMFDPHMLDQFGNRNSVSGAAAFLRFAGVTSFVTNLLLNYADLDAAKKGCPLPPVTLTDIEIVQKEPLIREPTFQLDLKAFKAHCLNEWMTINYNALCEQKQRGKYPLESLSAVSLATSRATSKKKFNEYYQKSPKELPPQFPVPPEKPPPLPTDEQIINMQGEDFFLYCPTADAHAYGRDDMAEVPRPKSETVLHSLVDIADLTFRSQYQQLDVGKWLLRATRHMASHRYQTFKTYSGIACCVAALAMLRRLRARGWNEDHLDETLDVGYNLYRESLKERGGPIRRLVLGELKDHFNIRDKEFTFKGKGIAVWGKLVSNDPKVFDLCRGIEHFFKESDAGVLQVPGEIETAIWQEGGKYYIYVPWPADRYGRKVDLRAGGKACLVCFDKVSRLCDYFMDNMAADMRRKPFSISDISVSERPKMPEPVNKLKAVAPNRWVVRGNFSETDAKFPTEHRGKQGTAMSVAAIAMSRVLDCADWTPKDVDEILNRGDILYQATLEHLDRIGTVVETHKVEEELETENEEIEVQGPPAGTLAAIDVMNRFKITDTDCIETDVLDSAYSGQIQGDHSSGILSLKDSLKKLFNENATHAVLTARDGSMAVWKQNDCYYLFDPHGCDENGYPSDEATAAACLVRVHGSVKDLSDSIESNLSPGSDDSYNLSPVSVCVTKLNPALGAPETNLESRAFEWISKGTAAIMPGPRGENSAIGKAAERAAVVEDDPAGRTLALPAAAAFTAAAVAVPPPHMHKDHMFNFLDAGADYYLKHVKKTGRKEILPEDLTEKFEMGANTFSIELGEPTTLPLRLPDEPAGEGEEEEEPDKEVGEEEDDAKGAHPIRQIKDVLEQMWLDNTKPCQVSLLVGDYHQLGVWVSPGGNVVAFDPAPTLGKGLLTSIRIKKGDQLRSARLKGESTGEADDEEEEEEVGAEGEEAPEEVKVVCPPEAFPALMVFSNPAEFINKLVYQAPLTRKQSLAPYKLYPVTVTNELTSVLKEKRPGLPQLRPEDDEEGSGDVGESLVEELSPEAIGKHMSRLSRSVASVRGRVAQNENYFMDTPNRDNQDAANALMGVVVSHIEPYVHWKPPLIDAILKYGDRLYTASLPNARGPPKVRVDELEEEFHVTNFNVRTEVDPVTEYGDIKAGDAGKVLNLRRAIAKFLENYGDIKAGDAGKVLNLRRAIAKFLENNKCGIICAKDYCAAIWKGADEKAVCYWDPHAIGPKGMTSPGGAAGLVVFSNVEELADTFKSNIEGLNRPGNNRFSIHSVKVFWELNKSPAQVTPQGQVPDEGYEWKVLTAYVETARGRTILRGSRPEDLTKFSRLSLLQTSCGAIVAACMSVIRRPHLWTRRTVDDIMKNADQLFSASLKSLGYEFRPGEDLLLPLQVVKRFVLGVNYVSYDLNEMYSGRLEQISPEHTTVRGALEHFFRHHSHGILWSQPRAVAVWRVRGAPQYYMMEPAACGATGLRGEDEEDVAACVLTFTSPKLLAFAYLQNYPMNERPKHEFNLYAMSIKVQPINKLTSDPPLVKPAKGLDLVPATSKVYMDGTKRKANEADRKHPPGDDTCLDAQRAMEDKDKEDDKYKGQRSASGWLVLKDGTQYLSAQHSINCKRFTQASRGNQAVPCCVMAVAMSRVEDVCRWTSFTLDQILDSGEQLYQDSYLHYKPNNTKLLTIQQVLRKFYTPGNCVCRVAVYEARQRGLVADLEDQMRQFFKEEKCGVLITGEGDIAVALFRNVKGFYMFDPWDRDRYGRAVAPPCVGKARACLSVYPHVQSLVEKLGANISPTSTATPAQETKYAIYGMEVSSLRRLSKRER